MATEKTVDEEFLQAFADAFNQHDAESLMTFMTTDCIFEASFGTSSFGTRYEGQIAVRGGFARAWEEYPDAQWKNARHFVHGNRGVSEWTFVGTRRNDGKRIETNGCDIFTFRDGLIQLKNSWRKTIIN